MKRICIALCLLIFPAIATITLATSALAQTVVVGTGNPDVDVPAVQAAVDQGGEIILKGHFSFDKPPTQPSEFPGYMVTILVSKAVAISGARDEDGRMREEDGEMTSIEAGTVPFYVQVREPPSPFRDCGSCTRRPRRSPCQPSADS